METRDAPNVKFVHLITVLVLVVVEDIGGSKSIEVDLQLMPNC